MNHVVRLSTTLLAASVLVACATMKHGTDQTVSVNTGNVRGAHCTLANKKGVWAVRSTPGRVKIKRSLSKLVVTCSKRGYRPVKQLVKAKVHHAVLGNVVMPGGSAGAVVDLANGAAYHYPETISVRLR